MFESKFHKRQMMETTQHALKISATHICKHTIPKVIEQTDLGVWWKLIYWVTFIVTFGKVKMDHFAFVIGDTMAVRDPSTISPELVFHEATHMRQREQVGRFWWLFSYILLLPTLFTMRSVYEREAYTVSAVVDAFTRRFPWPRHKGGEFLNNSKHYSLIRKKAHANIDHYIEKEFFGWAYFFMAVRKNAIRKKMKEDADNIIGYLFGAKGSKKHKLCDVLLAYYEVEK